MNIVLATSEVAPFAKTGGLADVCGSLPIALKQRGLDICVIMPAFRQIHSSGMPLRDLNIEFDVPISGKIVRGKLLESRLPGSDVPIYFIAQDDYFSRPELYVESGVDYQDNCERFSFFSRAVLEAIRLLDLPVDLIHCNDWPTGLIPAYLDIEYAKTPGYEQIASLYTIHNLAYQGVFWHWDMLLTGLDWRHFNWRQMEHHGQLNFMKTGIVFADSISTVSRRYAEEIQTSEYGCGLEETLRYRGDAVSGIMNGVDYRVWNPATDDLLSRQYDAETFVEGKAACKRALQQELGLADEPNTPLLGFVGRLAEQKGIELIVETMRNWLPGHDTQWAILGTGEQRYHEALAELGRQFPQHCGVRLEFSNKLAHQIEAGVDVFLMPSQYEPSGLNQLYSLKYGATPVVRKTGGLADTITDAGPENLAAGTANGYVFEPFDPGAFAWTLGRALDCYRHRTDEWRAIIENGMRQDWSWSASAEKYEQLYELTLYRHRSADASARS